MSDTTRYRVQGNFHDETCPLFDCAIENNFAYGGDGDVRCKGCEHDVCRCNCDE